MKLRKLIPVSLILICCICLSICSYQSHKTFSENYNSAIVCIKVEHDGSHTSRTWGSGCTKEDSPLSQQLGEIPIPEQITWVIDWL